MLFFNQEKEMIHWAVSSQPLFLHTFLSMSLWMCEYGSAFDLLMLY